MPMRREQVAAALRYLQDKADLRGRFERATSLDPQEQDLADIAVETGASLVPGVGPALAARDFERARRADDPAGMAMAAASAVPGGKLAGLLKRYDPVMRELDVYHGTPHRFPATEANPLGEFDASKIGTGEGAQAYGHGVYLAEAPEVAEVYRSATNPIARKAEMTLQMTNGNVNKAIEFVKREQKTYERFKNDPIFKQESYQQIVDTLDYLKQTKKGQKPEVGAFYKADLPDEMIDRMLDWDKPLSEQPALVKQLEASGFLKKAPAPFSNRYTGPTGTLIDLDSPGGNLVMGGGWNQKTSAALRDAGIPGIKYKDAGSRGKGGTGTRNFVVFPGEEKKVRILERDGQKAPPQKIAQALEAAPDYRMTHRPMSDAGGASRLHNAYESFGEDIYGPKALQYFGAGDPREAKVVAALKRLRDNPDAEVTIYRGVPKDATGEIGKGDWVTLDRSVAAEYGDKVLTKKVKAKDITTWPDSLLEFGYYPEN